MSLISVYIDLNKLCRQGRTEIIILSAIVGIYRFFLRKLLGAERSWLKSAPANVLEPTP